MAVFFLSDALICDFSGCRAYTATAFYRIEVSALVLLHYARRGQPLAFQYMCCNM